ncbi:DUF4214 domain-containing protein [Verticiella sediminum]|uniref:DUF4214 domain-containing protein n=1 Tax=Verticiella sediminum TaxID=1247510 RepID=A0A556AFF2_9BURK|nr:DUF4214 domain-containing protein [Verticiella sediminum]TSH91607.1 DUF4214 domain-containing protein [Verticiella sediminum]
MAITIPEAREAVAGLFISYLGRAPEYSAMTYYVGRLNDLVAAQEEEDVEAAVKALSAEIYATAGAVGEIPAGPNVTSAELVDWVYQNILGRAADTDGRAYWISELESGNFGPQDLVATVIAAVQGQGEGRDFDYFGNRVEVALEFAKFENSGPNVLPTLKYDAAQVLVGVTEDPATVEAAYDKLYTADNGGETFLLTPGVDILTGTSGDDVFVALPVDASDSATAKATLTAFDDLDGGAGWDTLNIYHNNNTNRVLDSTISISNIEEINLISLNGGKAFATGGGVIDASRFEGAKEINQIGAHREIINLAADTVAGFVDLEDDAALSVKAAGASATVGLGGLGGEVELEVSGDKLNSVTLVGELADEDSFVTLDLAYTAAKGTTSIALDTAFETELVVRGSNVTGVDASASSGDVTVAFRASAEKFNSFTGGAGDDTVLFMADRQIKLTDTLDGGEGVNTLALVQSTFQTEHYNAIGQAENFDALAVIAAGGQAIELDAAQVADFKVIGLGAAYVEDVSATVSNLAADQTLVLIEDEVYGFEIEGLSAVMLSNAAADVSLELDFLLDADFDPKEDVDLQDEMDADFDGYVALIIDDEAVGAKGGTLTVGGEGGLTYANEEGKFSTIDASELVGSFAVALSEKVAETLQLGDDSADAVFVLVAGSQFDEEEIESSASTLGQMDTIVGFNVEQDALFFGTGYESIREITLAEDTSSLNLAFSQAAQQYGEDDELVLFVYDGNTYIYADTVNPDAAAYDAGDFAVKLVGEYEASDIVVLVEQI